MIGLFGTLYSGQAMCANLASNGNKRKEGFVDWIPSRVSNLRTGPAAP
jgi:hypothetical protein